MSYESYGTYEPSPAERQRIEKERLKQLEEERQKAIAEARRLAAEDEARRNLWVRDYEATTARQRAAAKRAERNHATLLATDRRTPSVGAPPAGASLGERLARVRALLELVPERVPDDVEAPIGRVRTIVDRIRTASGPSPSDHEPLAEAERFLTTLPQLMRQCEARQRDLGDAAAAVVGELGVVVRRAEDSGLRRDAADLAVRVRSQSGHLSKEVLGPIVGEARLIQDRFRLEQARAAVRDALVERLTAALADLGYHVDPTPGSAASPGRITRTITSPDGVAATATIGDDRVMSLRLDVGEASRHVAPTPALSARERHWCATVDALQQRLRAEGFVVHEVRRDTLPPPVEADADGVDEIESDGDRTTDTPRRAHTRHLKPGR